MHIERLRIQGLRCLTEVELHLEPSLNLLVGANGAGKTSVLEAMFLLSHARSFRSGARNALMQHQGSQLSIYAELEKRGRIAHLGLGRTGSRWEAKLDSKVISLGEMVGECAVVCFEPGSHALIAGAAEERRRYMDWGVFHVEQQFLPVWTRYQRALKQRNALLRSAQRGDGALFEPWEQELQQAAQLIDAQRRAYLGRLLPKLQLSVAELLPELGAMTMTYRQGWPEETELAARLHDTRDGDLTRGHTTAGAHRADWVLSFEGAPSRDHLSRGQEKLTALACVLSQAALFSDYRNEWPVICLDDLASELDTEHQASVVRQLQEAGAQVVLTGTDIPIPLKRLAAPVFHVEQGKVSRLL